MRLGRTPVRTLRQSIALIGAAALLIGQLAATVHTHQSFAGERSGAVTQLSAGDVLCPLCLLAFHATPEPSAPPVMHHPEVGHELIGDPEFAVVESDAFARAMTRAPPALA